MAVIVYDEHSRKKPAGSRRLGALIVLAAAAFLSVAPIARAHDIPNDVTIQAYFRPSGQKLSLLVRVPMSAMRDMEFPQQRGGFLDIGRTTPLLPDAATLWISDFMTIEEDGKPLPKKPTVASVKVSLESDRSFDTWEHAYASVTGPPLPEDTRVVWNQTMFDVLLEYPIHSGNARFSLGLRGWSRLGLRVLSIIRYVMPDGEVRVFQFDPPPELVRLDPAWYEAALTFVRLGFLHILEGTDHLLFLFCLVIPFRKFRALVPIVTAFTVAHSMTLIASAYNLAPDALWFPPLIETLIAASIVYMALENIVGAGTVHKRWMIAFGFGLVHGFGFSFALRETLQLAGSYMLPSLLSFNLGVELGQLLVLLLLIPLLDLLFRKVVAERMGTIILSALVTDTAWHWMLARGEKVLLFHFEWPEMNLAFALTLIHWLMAVVALAGMVWLVSVLGEMRAKRKQQQALPTP